MVGGGGGGCGEGRGGGLGATGGVQSVIRQRISHTYTCQRSSADGAVPVALPPSHPVDVTHSLR